MKLSQDFTRIGIIPGIDGATTLLQPLAKELAPFHTVLLNYEDHGCSVEEVSDFLLERVLAEELSVLVGESFGGPVAISVASKIPNLRAIVLVSSFTTPPLQFFSVITNNNLLGVFVSAIFRTSIGSWLAASILLGDRSDLFHQFGEQVIRQILQLSPEVLMQRLRAILTFDISSKLHSLPPMLSIEARGDPLRWGAGVSFSNSGGTSVIVEGVHLLAETQPREIAELVVDFLEKLAS